MNKQNKEIGHTRKEAWKDSVMSSIEGMQQASPRPDLLGRIEHRLVALATREAKVISMRQIRVAVAAASLLIGLNAVTLYQSIQTPQNNQASATAECYGGDCLITNYSLYN